MAFGLLPVEEYLSKFAIEAYNLKYGQSLDYKNCGIASLRTSYGYKYGYRIDTLRGDDTVVIHLYFNIGPVNRVDIVRVEVIKDQYDTEALGDEIYVVTGEIFDYYGDYRFPYIENEFTNIDLIYYLDDDYVVFMDGTPAKWTS
jgi:hypothetical protein